MKEGLAKTTPPGVGGDRIEACSYPESESLFFKRTLGRDDLEPIHDDRAENYIVSYSLVSKRREVEQILDRIHHLKCENEPVKWPGRSAVVRTQIDEILSNMAKPDCRSFRWNKHYQATLAQLRAEMVRAHLKPLSLCAVAETETFRKNLKKNAGYMAFETGKRSKGQNLDEALRLAEASELQDVMRRHFCKPLVVAIRTSNSGISDWEAGTWKERTRPILMVDLRQLLQSSRFGVPFNEWFQSNVPWGEGGMTHQQVEQWTWKTRTRFRHWLSTDFSKYDSSQSSWLIEDAFSIVKAAFPGLNAHEEGLFETIVNSYIHKEIHSYNRIYSVHKGTTSGEIWTYTINTIIHRIIEVTIFRMMGVKRYESLLCGDDGLTYYDGELDLAKYSSLITRYFGIAVSMGKSTFGSARKDDPVFLSRRWTLAGASRPIEEVFFNLIYPERFRDYFASGLSEERAVTLLLMCAYYEQPESFRRYMNVDALERASGVRSVADAYRKLAKAGTGFETQWLRWQFGSGWIAA